MKFIEVTVEKTKTKIFLNTQHIIQVSKNRDNNNAKIIMVEFESPIITEEYYDDVKNKITG